MGTSFVNVGENGFWMRDGILELWLRLTALHIAEPGKADPVVSRIREQWLLASRGSFNGCVPVQLEGAVATKPGEAAVRGAINSLLRELERTPGPLDKDTLNLLGMEGRWEKDVETWRLIEVCRAFLDLLDGKTRGTARETAFMPGCGDRPKE